MEESCKKKFAFPSIGQLFCKPGPAHTSVNTLHARGKFLGSSTFFPFFLNPYVSQALGLKVLFLRDVNTIHVFPKMVLSLLFNMFFSTLYLETLDGRDSWYSNRYLYWKWMGCGGGGGGGTVGSKARGCIRPMWMKAWMRGGRRVHYFLQGTYFGSGSNRVCLGRSFQLLVCHFPVFFLGGDEFPLEEAVPSMGSSCLFLVKFFLQYDSLSLFQRFSVEFLSWIVRPGNRQRFLCHYRFFSFRF